jgi:hypothetical protein
MWSMLMSMIAVVFYVVRAARAGALGARRS